MSIIARSLRNAPPIARPLLLGAFQSNAQKDLTSQGQNSCIALPNGRSGGHIPHSQWFQVAGLKSAANLRIGTEQKDVMYKGRFMLVFRILVRAKIFQLTGVAAFALALGTFLSEGELSFLSLGVATALMVGCAVSATTLNFYSRRYIGELSMLKNSKEPALCFSVMDFWGHRADNVVPLANVVPPLRGLDATGLAEIAKQPLIPVQVDGDRQYYISLRHGILVDKDKLFKIMKGETKPQEQYL